MKRLAVWITLAACGGSHAAPDSGQGGAMLVASDASGGPVASLDFGTTAVGLQAGATVHVVNAGTGETGLLALSISGTDADDFVLANSMTTCAAADLRPAAGCDVGLVFRPSAPGDRTATLTIASSSSTLALKLTGHTAAVGFTVGQLDFGLIEVGHPAQQTIELHNSGSSDEPIDSIAVTGAAFSRGISTCGATLAPGTSCDLTVQATPEVLGVSTGQVTVTSGGAAVNAALSVEAGRRITVVMDGTGTGTVTSSPAGITCGTTCTALVETAVDLTVASGPNTVITSWSIDSCGTAATCTVPADLTEVTVHVTLSLTGASDLAIAFAGDAPGEVGVFWTSGGNMESAICYGPCTVPLTPGDQIYVAEATTSTDGGVSGACSSGTQGYCGFVAPVGSATITATFTKDPKEQWTRLFDAPVIGVTHDGSGDVIVATASEVTKLSSTGSTIWTVAVPALGVATGPNDSVYVVTSSRVVKLDASGATLFTASLDSYSTGGCTSSVGDRIEPCVAVGGDGAVVVHGVGVTQWDASGNLGWTAAGPANGLPGIAVDGQGVVYEGCQAVVDTLGACRFTAGGSALATWNDIGSGIRGEIAIDSDGQLVASTSFAGGVTFYRMQTTGAVDYTRAYQDMGIVDPVENGVAASAAGQLAWWYLTASYLDPRFGYHVSVFTNANADVWSLERPIYDNGSPAVPYPEWGTRPQRASYHGTQFVLGGVFEGFGPAEGWVQAFAP